MNENFPWIAELEQTEGLEKGHRRFIRRTEAGQDYVVLIHVSNRRGVDTARYELFAVANNAFPDLPLLGYIRAHQPEKAMARLEQFQSECLGRVVVVQYGFTKLADGFEAWHASSCPYLADGDLDGAKDNEVAMRAYTGQRGSVERPRRKAERSVRQITRLALGPTAMQPQKHRMLCLSQLMRAELGAMNPAEWQEYEIWANEVLLAHHGHFLAHQARPTIDVESSPATEFLPVPAGDG